MVTTAKRQLLQLRGRQGQYSGQKRRRWRERGKTSALGQRQDGGTDSRASGLCDFIPGTTVHDCTLRTVT